MLKIRNAELKDMETVAVFQIKMALETENVHLDRDTVLSGVEAVLTDPAKGRYIVAEEDGQIGASLLITYEWSDWRNGVVWWLQSLYVQPEWRRKGVFRAMFQFIKEMVECDAHIKGIRLYVDKTNTVAQETYRSLGMNGEHYKVFEWMKP